MSTKNPNNTQHEKTICPACKKGKIILYAGGGAGLYQCVACGYVGVLYLKKGKYF